MTEEVINKLPDELKEYICTLKKASTDTSNKEPMCESLMKVVNFDKIPNRYAKGRGWSGVPKSNDALYVDAENQWFFVEFKNGEVHKDDIYRKLYDSLIMLMEWGIIPDFEFGRKNINYILVFNEGQYKKVQQSPARDQTYNYMLKLAKQEKRLFDIDKFEKYLFKETHTYTKDEFEDNFVRIKEQEEEKMQS